MRWFLAPLSVLSLWVSGCSPKGAESGAAAPAIDPGPQTDGTTGSNTSPDTGTGTGSGPGTGSSTGSGTGSDQTTSNAALTILTTSQPGPAVVGNSLVFGFSLQAPAHSRSTGVTIAANAPFVVVDNLCGTSLDASSSCTFSLEVTCDAPGARSGNLVVNYAFEQVAKTLQTGISGTCIRPAMLAFDPADQSASTASGSTRDVNFTLRNSGDAAATELVFGGLAAPFAVHSNSCLESLAPGGSCTVVVRFTAGLPGTYTDSLTVDYENGATSVVASVDQTAIATPALLAVAGAYGDLPNQWNFYQKITDSTKPHWQQALDISEDNFHGGPLFKVAFPAKSSCDNLSLVDTLEAYDWTCVDAGGVVAFYSTLKEGKGLRDLIDSTPAWKGNRVSLSDGSTLIAQSAESVWFSNPVAALPSATSATVTLSDTGKVYVLTASASAKGYNINADGISLVALGGATLSMAGDDANCGNAGETSAPLYKCLISIGAQHRIWIEGDFDGAGAATSDGYGIYAKSSTGRIHNSRLQNFYSAAIWDRDGMMMTHVSAAQTESASGSCIRTKYSTLQDVHVSNCAKGLEVDAGGVYTRIYATHNGTGIRAGSGAYFVGVSTGYNSVAGMDLVSGSATVSLLSSVNDAVGLKVAGSAKVSGAAIAPTDVSDVAVELGAAANLTMSDYLLTSASPTCVVASGGLGIDTSCDKADDSTFTRTSTYFASAGYRGPYPSDSGDAENAQGGVGWQPHNAISDWTHFSSIAHAWGIKGAISNPAPDQRGPCTSGDCAIYRFQFYDGGPSFLHNRSGYGDSLNSDIAANQPCPSAITGNRVLPSALPALRAGIELAGDGFGNDNGLCESDEQCAFALNIGAYQGSSLATGACTFTNGAIAGVKVRWRTQN